MEKLATAIGIFLSLLSIGSAYDTFTTIGLWPKLYVTAAAAFLLVFSAARRFAQYLPQDDQYFGFGIPAPRRPPDRFALFSVLLAVCCALFIILALFLTQRFTLRLIETPGANASATLLIAPDASIESAA
jgi:hypothetical protein